MRHDFLDRYSRLDSPIHRLPAGVKLAVALAAVIVTVATPLSWRGWFIGWAIAVVGVAMLSRVPLLFLLKRFLWLEPFVIGIAVLTLLQPGGVAVFARIVVKSSLCLATMLVLSNTTPFAELLRLLRRIRVPALLVTTLALMYRYLFVLIDEAERMSRARASRTFTRSRWLTWKSLATVVGQLFVRSTERAERIYAAMCARGWR